MHYTVLWLLGVISGLVSALAAINWKVECDLEWDGIAQYNRAE